MAVKIWPFALTIGIGLAGPGAMAHEPVTTAVFPFEFVDTSLQGEIQGPRNDEQQRLASLDGQLRDMLASSGCCVMANMAQVMDPARRVDIRSCNGCDLDLARKVGAGISVIGWIQKVSNLILNLNVVVRDVRTGAVIRSGSVDIRGNTDDSWSRGLSYMIRNRLHPAEW